MADEQMDGADIRSRLVAMEHHTTSHGHRLTALEIWKQASDISDARKEEQWIALKNDLSGLKTGVGEVQGTLRWIGRTIVGAIIVAFMAFLIKGGFAPT